MAESDAVLGVHRAVGDEVWVVATRAGVDTVVRSAALDGDLGTFDQLGPVSVTAFAVDKGPTGGAYLLVQWLRLAAHALERTVRLGRAGAGLAG